MPTTMLPAAVRHFHKPPPQGAYMAGSLRIRGIGRFLFPASPVHTIVRTLPMPATDTVMWLRSFGGSTFVESTYARSSSAAVAADEVHDVETVWPLDFKLDFFTHGQRVSLVQRETTLLGVLPFPKWLVSLDLTLNLHAEGGGWDLCAFVRGMGGRLSLISYEGSLRPLEAQEHARYVPGFHHLLLFDGQCNLCNASVDFLLRFDRQQRLLFCPQQSPAAAEALRQHGHVLPPLGDDTDSVLLLAADGRLHANSDAALHAGAALGGLWAVAATAALVAVPRGLRDAAYRFVGRRRYAWFGKKDTCRLPTAEERRRFL